MSVSAHQLLIHQPELTLPFYRQQLGMELVDQYKTTMGTHYRLRFPNQDSGQAALELIYAPQQPLLIASQPSRTEGYWKITVAVPDIHAARERLLSYGTNIGNVFDVPDVATLCHLSDPEGYCIELLEYEPDTPPDTRLPLAGEARFLLSTYRVKDPQCSLEFYLKRGWFLVSRQIIASRQMTLYFLAPLDESLPTNDIDAIENRPWLWQRPYTLLEWQHFWGTENAESFVFKTDLSGGFAGLEIHSHASETGHQTITDPDGYRLKPAT